MHDLRFAFRRFLKSPGFTLIAVLALALGIGANSAIFSVVNSVLLRPLPFADPGQLVQLNETFPNGWGTVSAPTLRDWREQNSTFSHMVAYSPGSMNLQDIAAPERVAAVATEPGLFDMLGVPPIAGRALRPDDPRQVAVISATLWKRRFAADPGMVGKVIKLDGESHTVVGIMPEWFQFPYGMSRTEVWTPLEAPLRLLNDRQSHWMFVAGRLNKGVTIERARVDLGVIAKRLEKQYPDANTGRGVMITGLHDAVVGRQTRMALYVLLGAVGVVLLIACANVANLLLARAASRTREVAICCALGASRRRVVRQFLTESVLLGLAGGAAGLMVAAWLTDVLVRVAGAEIPRSWEISPDWRLFAFLLAISVAAGVTFGLAPAVAAARTDVHSGLKEGSRGTSGGARRFHDALVVAEIGLAFMLLIGAGLLLRTLFSLQATPSGLVTENVLTMRLEVARAPYGEPSAAARYYQQLLERVEALPGVRAAGFITLLPLQESGWNSDFSIEGRPDEPAGKQPLTEIRAISPGYFRALGIPILKGRDFGRQDAAVAPPVVIVNQTLARRHFPGEDPIGKHIRTAGFRGLTIVGIAGDVRQAALDRLPLAETYFPVSQIQLFEFLSTMSLVVSSQLPPESLIGAVREAVRSVNPGQALYNVKTMQRVVADSLSDRMLYLKLLGSFALLALTLALAGIYGVMSYAAARRTHARIRCSPGAGGGRGQAVAYGARARHGPGGAGPGAGDCGRLGAHRRAEDVSLWRTAD